MKKRFISILSIIFLFAIVACASSAFLPKAALAEGGTSLSECKAPVLTQTEFTYTGKEIKPSVLVYNIRGEFLSGEFYSIKYVDNINAGKGYVIVTGQQTYYGSIVLSFSIKPKTTEFNWTTGSEMTYSGENLLNSIEATSTIDNLTYALKFSAYQNGNLVTEMRNVGEYVVVGMFNDVTLNNNYAVANSSKTITVTQKPITLTTNQTTLIKEYDGNNVLDKQLVGGEDYSISGIALGDDVTVYTDSVTFSSSSALAATNSATATFSISGTAASNYILKTTSLTFGARVMPRSLTITINDVEATALDAAKTLSYSITSGSVISGDDLGLRMVTTAIYDKAGVYPIEGRYSNGEYAVTFVEGEYTVIRAAATVNVSVVKENGAYSVKVNCDADPDKYTTVITIYDSNNSLVEKIEKGEYTIKVVIVSDVYTGDATTKYTVIEESSTSSTDSSDSSTTDSTDSSTTSSDQSPSSGGCNYRFDYSYLAGVLFAMGMFLLKRKR